MPFICIQKHATTVLFSQRDLHSLNASKETFFPAIKEKNMTEKKETLKYKLGKIH